jgi:hypothetical protein
MTQENVAPAQNTAEMNLLRQSASLEHFTAKLIGSSNHSGNRGFSIPARPKFSWDLESLPEHHRSPLGLVSGLFMKFCLLAQEDTRQLFR